jgi:hypothetical protein
MEKSLLNCNPTRQQIFDHVCNHLAKQKKRSWDPVSGNCMYRYKGLSCAVGSLFIDEDYDPEMDNRSLSARPLIEHWFPAAFRVAALCRDLQAAHDSSGDAEDIRDKLREASEKYKLNPEAADLITEWEA